ncbi:glycoside hydrolase family 5 protein [Hygrophoropsis aurantiaca]|uniref:Glycoside hydrolase family 5 protein n=1 Tax=Hygrophoropsis aurantiaca TaxID=72124 RepID=A0ACB8A4Q3_9AGAM|nr:glycoside hydrolase family 5 protein [Hygrophoropsis aurantiaca]
MPKVPSVSPATGLPISPAFIHTIDSSFVDNSGRTLLLRGVNLSGSSKAPVGQPSEVWENFWESAEQGGESFIGRPLNLEDGSADEHLARLRGWGFNMLRFPVTWEALEHEGPGKYDYEFMDYTIAVLRKCKEYGFKVFLNPHQDTWSRFSGGSGAPFWTLAACGIEPRNLTATQSAIIHCEYPNPVARDPASFPAMIWSTNYGRLASQTLFALFFGGATFAPKCIIDGVNIQDYLQGHFIDAFGQLADRIKAADADGAGLFDEVIIGWDSMNEPNEGFIQFQDLNTTPAAQGSTLKKGSYPTPAQSLRLGMGQAQTVDNWTFGSFGPKKDGTVTIDPQGMKMWTDSSAEVDGVNAKWGWKRDAGWKLGVCIWALHGVWDVETGYVMIPDYFAFIPPTPTSPPSSAIPSPLVPGAEVHYLRDFWAPHLTRYFTRIRHSHPSAIAFIQPPVFAQPPPNVLPESLLRGRACYSTHYYDGLTLITRHWHWFNADALGVLRGRYKTTIGAVKFGEGAIRKSLQEQLGVLKSDALLLGDSDDDVNDGASAYKYPTIIGEIGTPMDMDSKRAYGYTDNGKYKGDYSNQEKALDASLNAADGPNALNWTVWTYCPDNSHEWGDGWNLEDLSLWSGDDMKANSVMERSSLIPSSSRLSLSSTVPTTLPPSATPTILIEEGSKRRIAPTYASLTNGARAVRAFCRPWPTAVVGKPVDIQFDIGKASFRLAVTVRKGDRALNRRDEENTNCQDAKDEDLPTEIYLPLVHFASDQCVSKSRPKSEQRADTDSDSDSESTSGSATPTPLSLPTPTSSTLTLSHLTSTAKGCDLDIDVKVSEGRWEVEGQTLRWWYGADVDDRAEKEVWIEVRRAKGPIKVRTQGRIQARNGCAEWLGLGGEGGAFRCLDGCCVM